MKTWIRTAAIAGIVAGAVLTMAGPAAAKSPGIGSGNVVQAPVEIPVGVCGNGVSVIGAVDPSIGGCEGA